jgi:hypothetical protein
VIAARRQNVMKQASSARQPMKCKSRNAATGQQCKEQRVSGYRNWRSGT